jgi:hypothetical protein
MIVIVSKVQVRRGLEIELPGAPVSLNPISLGPGLDIGELGFTEDTSRLFVGFNPTPNAVVFQRSVFPYQNVEVLTESSPKNQELFSGFIADQNENDFFVPIGIGQGGPSDIQYQTGTTATNPARLSGSNYSVVFEYHVFSAGGAAVQQGTLRIISGQATPNDDFFSASGGHDIQFNIDGPRTDSNGTFYILQCNNTTETDINLYLRRVVLTGG